MQQKTNSTDYRSAVPARYTSRGLFLHFSDMALSCTKPVQPSYGAPGQHSALSCTKPVQPSYGAPGQHSFFLYNLPGDQTNFVGGGGAAAGAEDDDPEAIGDTIRCPCPKCGFMKWHNRVEVQEHLILKQFPKNYVIWNFHGEKQTKDISRNENPMEAMINEAFEHYRQEGINIARSQPVGVNDVLNERPRENHNEFASYTTIPSSSSNQWQQKFNNLESQEGDDANEPKSPLGIIGSSFASNI
ncbi:hypothetical protein V8G54_012635 [Vigna mungo]|uniref:Transposase-associated domain-containing protein n=1 Tax=Vigna mungo TaxID=3915 RepID=A0AAQ3S0T1_VIGMU